mmetsp:Transcript_23360/g.68596  ORF Transcript_23360/g.68596 Transcript_23360/m.68596 type:complete len:102 (+) Transcript_23360:745-1050(+)
MTSPSPSATEDRFIVAPRRSPLSPSRPRGDAGATASMQLSLLARLVARLARFGGYRLLWTWRSFTVFMEGLVLSVTWKARTLLIFLASTTQRCDSLRVGCS